MRLLALGFASWMAIMVEGCVAEKASASRRATFELMRVVMGTYRRQTRQHLQKRQNFSLLGGG